MKWHYKSQTIPQTIEELKDVLLDTREVDDKKDFFHPKHPKDITLEEVNIDPEQMKHSIKRIEQAIENQEKIIIFGDYDADGITATSILWLALHSLGAQAFPFIPHREKHGYGISHRALDDLLAGDKKPDLIITVDNGIVAHEAVQRVRDEGIDIIVTDHHTAEMTNDKVQMPNANAIVHTTKLCGASVAWMVVREIGKQQAASSKQGINAQSYLDLAGIGTIADQVPLKGENRSFAKYGLEALQKTKNPGLLALFEIAGINQREIDTYHVNFAIAPRINAMGRLEHGLDALRLLCSQNKPAAQKRAKLLSDTNSRRQDLTYDMVEAAKAQAEVWADEHIIIVHSSEYHEGVIGLIAGKLTEEFYKPAIAISVGDETAKASARSVAGVNIVELIRQVRDDLLEVGGHPMAAGFGLTSSNIEIVSSKLRELAKEKISANLLQPQLNLECEIDATLIDLDTVEMIEDFAPFGSGNRRPVFGIKNLKIVDVKKIGREGKHLKMSVTHRTPYTAIAWNLGHLADELSPGDIIDVAGSLQVNEWNGNRSVQVVVKDVSS